MPRSPAPRAPLARVRPAPTRAPAPPSALLAALAALATGALSAACGGAADGGPCAVLITLDTTRWDVVGAQGGRASVTPHLDALAAEGVSYVQAHTVVPLTLPSHASMLTGLYPPRHTVRDNNAKLPDAATTLAERARAGGLATAAFVASAALDRATGADQGFELFDQPAPPELQTRHEYAERPAREVTSAALRWLAERDRARPFLLWVHYFDPHAPYEPPAGLAERTGHPYLGEVAEMDREIGRLLAGLRADPAWERTLVVAVADHGEALGEHGEPTHSAFAYEPVLRVPLVVRAPGSPRAGERSAEIATVADVFPTVLEHLALGAPGDVDGLSLLRPLPADRGVYFECYYGYLYYGWAPIAGWLDRRAKYVHGPRPELYDLSADPGETRPLDELLPRVAPDYRAAIAAVAARPPLAPDPDAGLDQEHLTRLQAIGYAAGGTAGLALPGPLEATGRPAPRDRADELARFLACQGLAAERPEEAIAGLERIVREGPLHVYALYELGQLYKRTRRFGEAVEPLRRTIELGNDWFGPRFNLGVVLARLGRTAEAEEHLRRTLELKPDFALAYDELEALYAASGRDADAAAVRAEKRAAGL